MNGAMGCKRYRNKSVRASITIGGGREEGRVGVKEKESEEQIWKRNASGAEDVNLAHYSHCKMQTRL